MKQNSYPLIFPVGKIPQFRDKNPKFPVAGKSFGTWKRLPVKGKP